MKNIDLDHIMQNFEKARKIDLDKLNTYSDLSQFQLFLEFNNTLATSDNEIYLLNVYLSQNLDEEDKLRLLVLLCYNFSYLERGLEKVFTYYENQITPYINKSISENNNLILLQVIMIDLFILVMKSMLSDDWERYEERVYQAIKIDSLDELVSNHHQIVTTFILSSNIELVSIVEPKKLIINSITSLKKFFSLLFSLFPGSVLPIIELINEGIFSSKSTTNQWINSMIEICPYITYPSDHKKEIIKFLSQISTEHIQQVRRSSIISLWLISDNQAYIEKAMKNEDGKTDRKYEKILQNPKKEREKYFNRSLKKFDELKLLTKMKDNRETHDYSPNDIYILQIKKGKRTKLAIEGASSLDDLAYQIINAYDLESFHLYAFFMDNKFWSRNNAYYSPDDDTGPFTNEKSLHQLNLVARQKFKFLYDYGSEFRFTIEVLEISKINEFKDQLPKFL